MPEPCTPCAEYQRGERDDLEQYGVTIHVCERKREGEWGFQACLCGCVKPRPAFDEEENR